MRNRVRTLPSVPASYGRILATVITLLPLFLGVSVRAAFAFVDPVGGTAAPTVIAVPEGDPTLFGRFVRSEERIDSGLASFRSAVGGSWAIQRNPVTGTPHQVVGSGIDYASTPLSGNDDALRVARRFLSEHAAFFQVDIDRLGEPWIERSGGKWSVVFRETYGGIPVRGGRAHVVFTEGGRIFAAGSDFHPSIVADVANLMPSSDAVAIAKGEMGFVDGSDFMREEPELFIYPVRSGSGFLYRPTWKVILHMQNPFGGWENWVDANTGEIYARRDMYEYVDVTGVIHGAVSDPEYCVPSADLPLKGMNVNLNGGTAVQSLDDGSFVIPYGGADSVVVTTRFRGPDFRQYNNAGPVARDTARIIAGETADLWFDDTNSDATERAAWYQHYVVRDFIKSIDPGLSAADYQMPVTLNRTDGYCPGNAWFDGTGTNFCLGSGGNANTGELGGVIYHEYGHGVNGWTYNGGGFSGALSEGNADVLTLMILHRPTMGIGFSQGECNRGIRSASQGFRFPDDLVGEGHTDGQAISGFFWEVRNRMITSYGEAYTDSVLPRLWHFSRKLGKPYTLQDQVTWAFIYDDVDGNLDTGTPNFTELAGAAAEIGFTVPTISQGVQIVHAGLPSTTDTLSTRVVTGVVTGLSGGIDPSSVLLHYRVNGSAFTDVPMTPTANPGEYAASIPAMPEDSRVEYYLEAADSASHIDFSPTNAPARLHWYDVAFIYDPCESAAGWTLGDSLDDATKGTWINADPVGNVTRPEDDVTPDGVNCFVTGNSGNVNGGTTTLYSPFYQLGGTNQATARYRRWYSNNYGANGVLATLDDWWIVDASADGGMTWSMVENEPAGSESWVEVEVDLGALFGVVDSVQFRFTARDTGEATRVHAAVDEVRFVKPLATDVASTGGGREAPGVFRLEANRPNPFNPLTTIAFDLPVRSQVRLEVFDVAGRRVKSLLSGWRDAGRHEVSWNGTDDRGAEAGSGVYFYRLESGSKRSVKKMTLVR